MPTCKKMEEGVAGRSFGLSQVERPLACLRDAAHAVIFALGGLKIAQVSVAT